MLGHRPVEAEVAHDGGREGIVAQRSAFLQRHRKHRHDLVTVDHLAAGIDGEAPVCVPVVGQARGCAVRAHCLSQRVEVGRAASVVDAIAIRLVVDDNDISTGRTVRRRCRRTGRTVRAVDDDAQALEPLRQGRDQPVDVPVGPAVEVGHDAPDRRPGRSRASRRSQPFLDGVFRRTCQLGAARAEELEPVVGHRVVAGRDHHAEGRRRFTDRGHRRRRRHRRSGYDAEAQDVRAGGQQAGGNRRLQEVTRRARVPAEHHQWPL